MANDTHGASGTGWYGFDLDGTLAKYDGWKGIDNIGDPVAPMVKLIRQMHDEGKVVKILTARVAPKEKPETKPSPYRTGNWCIQEPDAQTWAFKDEWTTLEFIQEWCYRILGFVPEITHEKDHLMLELYDDRVKQVIPNTGILIEDELDRTRRLAADLMDINQGLARAEAIGRTLIRCLIGCLIGILLVSVSLLIHSSCAPTEAEAEAELIEALREYRESTKPNFVRELFTGSEEQK